MLVCLLISHTDKIQAVISRKQSCERALRIETKLESWNTPHQKAQFETQWTWTYLYREQKSATHTRTQSFYLAPSNGEHTHSVHTHEKHTHLPAKMKHNQTIHKERTKTKEELRRIELSQSGPFVTSKTPWKQTTKTQSLNLKTKQTTKHELNILLVRPPPPSAMCAPLIPKYSPIKTGQPYR